MRGIIKDLQQRELQPGSYSGVGTVHQKDGDEAYNAVHANQEACFNNNVVGYYAGPVSFDQLGISMGRMA